MSNEFLFASSFSLLPFSSLISWFCLLSASCFQLLFTSSYFLLIVDSRFQLIFVSNSLLFLAASNWLWSCDLCIVMALHYYAGHQTQQWLIFYLPSGLNMIDINKELPIQISTSPHSYIDLVQNLLSTLITSPQQRTKPLQGSKPL